MTCPQNPYFNIMKHYPLSLWKKRGNVNEMCFVTDPTIKSKVLLIDGLVTAVNHITTPNNEKCNLSLTDEYLYLIFKPVKNKKFLIRLDCRTESTVAYRVTVTNAVRFPKVSNLSLCLPLPSLTASPDLEEPKWVILRFDLRKIINKYSNYHYHSLIRLQLCCSLLIYAAFTSDNKYSPFVVRKKNMLKNSVLPLPKEFQPVLNLQKLYETFELVTIPEDGTEDFEAKNTGNTKTTENINLLSSVENKNCGQSPHLTGPNTLENVHKHRENIVRDDYEMSSTDELNHEMSVLQADGAHVLFTNISNQTIENNANDMSFDLVYVASCPSYCTSLIITQNGCVIIFPCATYLIVMEVGSRRQCFLEGHTAEVSGICQDPGGQIIASCQSSTLSSINLCLGVVHVWRMPNLLQSSLHIQKPLGTGRVQNAQSMKGLCISDRGEFLIAYGMDVRSRGMIVVWDLRNLLHSSVLPLLIRSTVDNTISCFCLLPDYYKQNDVPDSFIRFATVSGLNTSHNTMDWNIADRYQGIKKNKFSEIRLWRFKYASLRQDTVQKCGISFNGTLKNKYHLSSSVVSLASLTVPALRQSLNFVSCCIKPQFQNLNQSCNKLNYSLLVGSSTGHILEVDLNLFCISNMYQLTEKSQEKKSTEHSSTVELQLSAFREFRNNQWILNFPDNLNHLKSNLVSIASMHWITPGINFSLGWLAACTSDGRLFLWESSNSLSSVALSVKYPSTITALDSCFSKQGTLNRNTQHQVYISVATCSGGLACLDLNFEFDLHKNSMENNETNIINEFKLLNCSPRRILSWQASGPIIATDLVHIDKLESQCILATLSIDGGLRIRHISSRPTFTNQFEDVEMKRINVHENYTNKELVENPLVDLIISDGTPACIAIQPKLNWSELNLEDLDISWIQIACGYSKTGLVRVFSPANAQMLYELNFHKDCDVTALLYSPCGSYLYTSDSSGQLAVWKITHDDKQRLYESQLIHSLNYQIGIFNITKPMLTMMKQDNHLVLSEIRKSIITVSSKGLHIAYMGPRLDMLTIAKGVNALTVKQIDLSHLILQHFPNNQTKSTLNQDNNSINSLNFIQFYSQCHKTKNLNHNNDTGHDDDNDDEFLFICTSQGYLFKYSLFDSKLISCAEFNVVSNSKTTVYVNAVKITPNGQTLLLAESSTPFIYISSTNLYPLYENISKSIDKNDKTLNRSIIYRKFTGHIYPIDNFYITLDGQYCISIDKGCWCQYPHFVKTKTKPEIYNITITKEMKASSIFMWKFDSTQRSHELKVKNNSNNNVNMLKDKLQTTENSTFTQPFLSYECENKSFTPINQCNTMETNINNNNNNTFGKVVNKNCEINKQLNIQYNYCPLAHRHWTVYANSKLNTAKGFKPNLLDQLKLTLINDNCMKGIVVGFGCFNHMIDNLIWDSDTGIFIYTYESLLVIEELETGLQLAFRSIVLGSLDCTTNFAGEIFNSLALAPNKSVLVIGSTTYWDFNEDNSSCTNISSFITVPIKFTLYNGHRQLSHLSSAFPTLKYDQSKRFLLSTNNSSIGKAIDPDSLIEINSDVYGILLTMTFTMDSRYLITIEDYHTNEVKLWSVLNWTLLSTVNIDGYFNQILCSPLFGNEFITIGAQLNQIDNDNVKLLNHESSILFWKFDVNHSTHINDEIVNINNVNSKDLVNARDILSYTKGKNWSFNQNKFLYNTEFCSAAYLKIPSKYDYYTTMHKMTLLILVSDNFGNISIWDVNNHMCLHNFSAECSEISVISSGGSYGFVTGSVNGSLRFWRLETEFPINEQLSNNQHYSFHNNSDVSRNGIKNIEVKQIKYINHFDNEVILSACFDVEGQIGVISTSNCNVWYVDWSEVEESTNQKISSVNHSLSKMQDYLTLLSSGYKTQIIGLIWWTKSQQQLFNENFLDNNDFSHMNDILITCTSDGNIQLWNPETCHLVSELKTNESANSLNGSTVDLCLLDYPGVICSGSEAAGVNETLSFKEDSNNKKSPGCLAIAYTDTCVRLFCLHKMCLVSESERIFPQLDDQITVIRFFSPYYLIIGTRNGLLVLLSIGYNTENNNTDDKLYSQPILIKRIIKDYLVNYQIPMPILCLNTYSQPLLYDYYLHQLKQDSKQTMDSIIKSDMNEHNQSQSWICLAIGAENRLSVWNLSICANPYHHNPLRFYLLAWLPLESLEFNNNNNSDDKNEHAELSYHANFLPTQNLKDVLKLISYDEEIHEKIDNPFIMIYATNEITEITNLWIYSIDDLIKAQPESSSSSCLQITGKVESINPVFILPSSNTKTYHLTLSYLQLITLTRSSLNKYQTEIQLLNFYSNGLQIKSKKTIGPQYVHNACMKDNQHYVSSFPLIKSIIIQEKNKIYIAAAYGKELFIWEETYHSENNSLYYS
ncbi:WD repeat-containing protein 90, variant 2 [Schistosoma haematobium]|uniref:WD repeat-containing protein 90 n=2 Tax=Schistosoma haematobium TaxID=6185 RepID=A0A094ZUJ6_SCHHA|nr:WD repeat-containing protein 90, variant 2 [Schistosoma haematobium]KAH9587825.1 WD repeat-containing protein 90, variant 2 [Schistosoma haematobium]CAH8558388.1 unnamed protein product [Schistosoma haematobium]